MSKEFTQFNVKLGDKVRIPDPTANFNAVVAGIDRYTEHTLTGRVNTWISYTVTSDAPANSKWSRFYLVDGQADKETGEAFALRSYYVLDTATEVPDGFKLDQNLSGYVELASEGDAQLSSGADAKEGNSIGVGSLHTFRHPDGRVWAREVFKGSGPLSFEAVFEPKQP